MNCSQCGDEITGRPVKQGGEFYCSLECANQASGHNEDQDSFYEESDLEGLYNMINSGFTGLFPKGIVANHD